MYRMITNADFCNDKVQKYLLTVKVHQINLLYFTLLADGKVEGRFLRAKTLTVPKKLQNIKIEIQTNICFIYFLNFIVIT